MLPLPFLQSPDFILFIFIEGGLGGIWKALLVEWGDVTDERTCLAEWRMDVRA